MKPFKIAVASGKGGTGKTTVSVNLFHFLSQIQGGRIHLMDCDVEEPNDLIFFPKGKQVKTETIFQLIPEIDISKCTFCRKCAEYCEFNALVIIPPAQFAETNKSLCHSCGACLVACAYNAIAEKQESIGTVNTYSLNNGAKLAEGRLKIGSAMQTMLIKELKRRIPDGTDIIIFDAPPGTSCPVVETISDADYVILVTEPTPFGLHDLKLMIELLDDLKKSYGVVINKAGLGNRTLYDYLDEKNIEILCELPFEKDYAALYSMGELFQGISPVFSEKYEELVKKLERKLQVHEGNNYFKW